MGELQSLSTVQGHQENAVVVSLHAVDIRDQGHFLQKTGEGGHFFGIDAVFVIRDLADQLVQVGDPVLSILLV